MKHTVALKQNHEFRRLYSKGRSAVSPYFVLYCRPNRRSYSRLGITTGVKLGNAVKRNRARRRIRELYRGEEQALLLPKMDAYCQTRLGQTLEECCADYLSEQSQESPEMQM